MGCAARNVTMGTHCAACIEKGMEVHTRAHTTHRDEAGRDAALTNRCAHERPEGCATVAVLAAHLQHAKK